jgi:hypothetical protein
MAEYDESLGGVFDKYIPKVWDNTYEVKLHFLDIAGGVPSDPKVAEGWLKSKMNDGTKEEQLRRAVETIMLERGLTQEEAVEELNKHRNVNGFKRGVKTGQLYIEGRQVKAAIKEAASVAVASGKLKSGNTTKAGTASDSKWGKTSKGSQGFIAEHIQVLTRQVWLEDVDGNPITKETFVKQSFPVNPITRQTGIQYTEVCEDVQATFWVTSDWDFTEEQWSTIWVTGQLQGIGASRSQDYGRYKVVGWKRVQRKK